MSDTPKDPHAPSNDPHDKAEPQVFQAATAMFTAPSQVAAPAQAPEAPVQSAAADAVWHVVVGSSQEGPMTQEEVAHRLASHAIARETLVWRAGLSNWSALQEVPELAHLLPPASNPAPERFGQGAMGPAAEAALSALMAADMQQLQQPEPQHHAAAAPAAAVPTSHAAPAQAPQNLANQDLFGNNETQFLQVPQTATAAPAKAAAATVAAVRPRKLYWALGAAMLVALAAGVGVYVARPTATEVQPTPAVAPAAPTQAPAAVPAAATAAPGSAAEAPPTLPPKAAAPEPAAAQSAAGPAEEAKSAAAAAPPDDPKSVQAPEHKASQRNKEGRGHHKKGRGRRHHR